MNCPKCDMGETRVLETRGRGDHDLRRRLCRNCGTTFPTIERPVSYDSKREEYVETKPVKKKPLKPASFHPVLPEEVDDDISALAAEARYLFLLWWNESRRSKHGSKAAWTRMAFTQNLKRVAALPGWKQKQLCEQGVEMGWQALKVEYMSAEAPPVEAGLTPKSNAMQEAIQRWNMQAQ